LSLAIIPSPMIGASLAASVAVPVLLIVLSRWPFLVRDLRTRFRLSCFIAVGLWGVVVLLDDKLWRLDPKAFGDIAAGALLILSSILTTFIVWILVALGISTSLLVSLSERADPVEPQAWLADYGPGYGVQDVFKDRLTVLLNSRAALLNGTSLSIASHRGRLTAWLVDIAMVYFGFPKAKR